MYFTFIPAGSLLGLRDLVFLLGKTGVEGKKKGDTHTQDAIGFLAGKLWQGVVVICIFMLSWFFSHYMPDSCLVYHSGVASGAIC